MLKISAMGISLFLIIKVASGMYLPGKNSPVTYRENGPGRAVNLLNIKAQPTNQTDCKGNKVTFAVAVDGGTGPIQFQWQRERPGDSAFAAFGASDSVKLPVYNIGVGSEAPDGTLYRVVVSDQNGVVISGSASLNVNQITGIDPVGVATYTRNEGENLWFKVLISGNSPSSYQWVKKLAPNNWGDLTDNSIISGSRGEQLNFTGISLADSGIYKVRVTFPTIDGNQCTETSSITRTVHVLRDSEPPTFVNLNDKDTTLCPEDIEMAEWADSLKDIQPGRSNIFLLQKYNAGFDLPISCFSDNLTPPARLILHWGIFSTRTPFKPIMDEAGTLLEDQTGQISLHPENINFEALVPGSPACQIIFWLEDGAGNLTPVANRYKIFITVPPRPEIVSRF